MAMRPNEKELLNQMLLHREFSVVAKFVGNSQVFAAIARTTGDADNGNQYWVQIKDGFTRYEACIVGDWEFDSLISALDKIYRETGGLLKGDTNGHGGFALNPQTTDGLWLAPNEELLTLMKVALSFASGDTASGEEAERGTLFNFGLYTTSQQLLVQVEQPDDIGRITRTRYDVLAGGSAPTVPISLDALTCLMDVTLGECPEFGLLRYPRRDWIIGFTDLAGRATSDEVGYAVRSIEERHDRPHAERSLGNGALTILKSVSRFRVIESMQRITAEHLVAHLFASNLGQALRDHVVQGNQMEFAFDQTKVIEQGDNLADFPEALAILLIPAAVLTGTTKPAAVPSKTNPNAGGNDPAAKKNY